MAIAEDYRLQTYQLLQISYSPAALIEVCASVAVLPENIHRVEPKIDNPGIVHSVNFANFLHSHWGTVSETPSMDKLLRAVEMIGFACEGAKLLGLPSDYIRSLESARDSRLSALEDKAVTCQGFECAFLAERTADGTPDFVPWTLPLSRTSRNQIPETPHDGLITLWVHDQFHGEDVATLRQLVTANSDWNSVYRDYIHLSTPKNVAALPLPASMCPGIAVTKGEVQNAYCAFMTEMPHLGRDVILRAYHGPDEKYWWRVEGPGITEPSCVLNETYEDDVIGTIELTRVAKTYSVGDTVSFLRDSLLVLLDKPHPRTKQIVYNIVQRLKKDDIVDLMRQCAESSPATFASPEVENLLRSRILLERLKPDYLVSKTLKELDALYNPHKVAIQRIGMHSYYMIKDGNGKGLKKKAKGAWWGEQPNYVVWEQDPYWNEYEFG